MFGEKKIAVLKIRAKILQAARSWLDQSGYVEVQGPVIIPDVGGTGSFEVEYFDKKAYLAQGLHPYSNAFAACLDKIYTMAPAFSAEKLATGRHLAEYWRIQVAQQNDFERIVSVQEELISNICKTLSAEGCEVLKCLNRPIDDLWKVQIPFPRLTYDTALEVLQNEGFKLCWGQTINSEMERCLSLKFRQPFFIIYFPVGIETSLFKSVPEKPELTLSADLIAPAGFGEIGSGAQMITEKEVLDRKMIEEKTPYSSRLWYLNLACSNSVPQSGFAFGVERLVQWICNLSDISEAVAFPRPPMGDLV